MFPKLEKLDTSLYMYGWGGSITDAEVAMTPLMRNRGEKSVGQYNFGNWRGRQVRSRWPPRPAEEADPKKREELIKAALRESPRAGTHLIRCTAR